MPDTQSDRSIAYSHAPFSTWLGVVFLFILFGLIVLAVIGPSPRTSDYEETRAKKRMEKLKALQQETQKDLTMYAWVDKNKGVARIPIGRAMEVTVAELAQKKPAPAGPIATPASAGASPAPGAPAAASPTGTSPAPAANQQPDKVKSDQPSAPAAPPAGQTAPPPAGSQQSPGAPASPAPATTP